MNTQFKAKFLNHLNQRKKGDKGFTLIELLVVIIIIGILAAIALPAFLNQANKAKQSEAKQYVGSLMRAQQAYYLEKSSFTSDVNVLGRPVASDTDNYTYPMVITAPGTVTETINITGKNKATKPSLKSYIGGVALAVIPATSETTTGALLCEATGPNTTPTPLTQANIAPPAGTPTCSAGTVKVGT
ncbi:MAG: hypothetical protein DCF22_11215 [Leptolyngbya sp.]|nr:MAG: hypothetical protein DCF22_11215 [Leptolyngbya sp.]